MKSNSTLFVALALFLGSCGGDHDHHGHSGVHVHTAPNGGKLIELGEHGSGHNLELFLHEDGFLQVFILDAHAENAVRIAQSTIEVVTTDTNGSGKIFVCDAIPDPASGETVGDTSVFTSRERVSGDLPLKATIPSLGVLGKTYEQISFEFSGNAAAHHDDH